MGCLHFFDEEVSLDNNSRVKCEESQVAVLDNHSVPEITITLGADNISRATFNDWNSLKDLLNQLII